MTNEQVIAYGKDYYRDLTTACCEIDEKHKEFVRMAIQKLSQEPTIQDKQAESEKYQKAFDDGYANGYAQARFDYEQEPQCTEHPCLGTLCRYYKELCDDAISREAVMRLIENKPYDWSNLTERHNMLMEIRKLPPVTQKSGKWIPVSERLPNRDEYIKNNGLFIVSDGNRSYSEWFDIYDKKGFGEPTMYGFRIDRCVIVWMPLPKPYVSQESEE